MFMVLLLLLFKNMKFTDRCHKHLRCKYTMYVLLGLLYDTSLRHADLREYCSYSWADRLDRTAHNSNKYLKQSIKIMLSIRLWKWKHIYFHIYDNAHYISCQVGNYLELLFMVKMRFTKFDKFLWHLMWLQYKVTWQIASKHS